MERTPRPGYDWPACLASLVAAFAAGIPLGLVTYRLTDSGGLMSTVITFTGLAVSRIVYARMARRGARQLDDGL
jgi:hypothetical protein